MQVSKRLVVRKEIPMDNSRDLISSMDVAMAEYYCKNNNYDRGLEIYREAISSITDEAERNCLIRQLTMLRSLILIKNILRQSNSTEIL